MIESILLNPELYKAFFSSEEFSLVNCNVGAIHLIYDGPVIKVGIVIENKLKSMPKKWPTNTTLINIGFQLIDIVNVELKGWSNNNFADLVIEKVGDNIHFRVSGETVFLNVVSKFIRMDYVEPV